jgi:hypothetical protein
MKKPDNVATALIISQWNLQGTTKLGDKLIWARQVHSALRSRLLNAAVTAMGENADKFVLLLHVDRFLKWQKLNRAGI